MDNGQHLKPRDIVKMAFQYQQTEYVPYGYWLDEKQEAALNDYYGDESWRSRIIDYIGDMGFIDGFLSANGMIKQSDGSERDLFRQLMENVDRLAAGRLATEGT